MAKLVEIGGGLTSQITLPVTDYSIYGKHIIIQRKSWKVE